MAGADPRRLALLVSGTGRHLENLARLTQAGELDASVALVVASRPGIGALERAARLELPVWVLEGTRGVSPAELSTRIFERLDAEGCGTAVLAGWLKRLVLPPAWDGRVLNIHPSLLPAFGGQGFFGHHVHEAVLARGCKVSGCTVHYVDDEYDHGPILAQEAIRVQADDDAERLAARVFEAELEAYPAALRAHFARTPQP